jgi:hypothetical protein
MRARGISCLALLLGGCASAPPLPPPVQLVRIEPGCRAIAPDGPAAPYVVLGRVSADVPIDADQRAIDERLGGQACRLGADAIVRDGAEPLIPQPTEGRVTVVGYQELLQLAPPTIAAREQRVFAQAVRFVR